MEALKGITRVQTGSRATRKIRSQAMIPGIIYGHGEANVAFAINAHDLEMVLQHGERVVEMDLEGKKDNYLIKEVQRDAFDNTVIHVDFTRVNLDETVEVTVALTLKGTAAGEAEGGVVSPGTVEVDVECRVNEIPDEIEVRINELQLDGVIRVGDVQAPSGVKILTDPDTIVASCHAIAEAPEPEEEAGEAEPEVIGKGKEDQEEGSAE